MNHILIAIAATALLSAPALAQEADDHARHNDHSQDEHGAQDHNAHDHEAHQQTEETPATGAPLQLTPEIEAALAAGGEPVVADMLGVVCDFCAKAMNKTFGKREEVAAVYVDLDTKTLSLVFKPGMTLDDERIHALVEKSGYRAAAIRRGEAALKGASDATDAS
ncbi:MAG: heavy-metal-associated domain-containing protein [Pseudomonadota bacterium]